MAPTPTSLPIIQHAVTVIAHRADHTKAHENTIRAIEHAIASGADYVELDVRRTRDGRHVLSHDATVNRMTDGRGKVADLTLAQIQALRVRDPKRSELGEDRIPTFEEALAACRDRIHIYLDFKEGDRAKVVEAIREAGMSRQVLVYCGARDVGAWRAVAPEFPLIVSPPKAVAAKAEALVAWVETKRVEVLDGDWSLYTADSVAAVEKRGVRVWPDIQGRREDEAYWRQVFAIGFTGVQSDNPGELRRWLLAR